MLHCRHLAGASSLALLAAMGFAAPANAQDDTAEVAEVIVTGSFIAGSPEDAAAAGAGFAQSVPRRPPCPAARPQPPSTSASSGLGKRR